MMSGERIGPDDVDSLRLADLVRWGAAFCLVGLGVFGIETALARYVPPRLTLSEQSPAILLDLAPIPAPDPETEPVLDAPEQIVEPEPEPEPIAEPEPEPEQELFEELAVEPLPEPEMPIDQPEPEPELPQVQPEPEDAPQPEPEEVVADATLPMPVSLSPDLQRRREDTPKTTWQAPRNQQSRPSPQASSVPAPAASAASSMSTQQWQQQALRHLERRKVYPASAQRAGETGAVTIAFSVNATGQVASVRVLRSSGFASLDQAAIETAYRASPLPPPPSSVVGQIVDATLRFTLR